MLILTVRFFKEVDLLSYRPQRVAELIKIEVSQIIREELKDPRINQVISITTVRVTNDLKHAKIFISVLGSQKDKESLIKGLDAATGFVKKELAKRIKMRFIPDIQFQLDNSIEYGFEISKILKDINKGDQNDI